MKHLNVALIILLIASIVACSKSSKVPAQETPATSSSTTQTTPTTTKLSQSTNSPTTNPNTATSLKGAESTTLAGANPPHGQPNHRCDIAVGAPLNSPAGTGLQQSNSMQPTTQQPNVSVLPAPNATTPITTAATAPGMNPPHGQPGHRCDIRVGAPLPAAPATTK